MDRDFSAVYRFDSSWRLVAVASHPSCASIHDLTLHGGYLWLCSTSNNRVMQFDESGALVGQVDPLSFETVRRGLPWLPRRHLEGAATQHPCCTGKSAATSSAALKNYRRG